MRNGALGEIFFPPNVVAIIFSYLRIYEIARCACVSKSWWYASHPAIPNKKAKSRDAWLNGDVEPIVVGEVNFEDCEGVLFERNLVAACGKGFLKLWYLDEDKFVDASENVGSKTLLDVCIFNGKIITGDDEGYIIAWDPCNWNCLFKIEAHGTGVYLLKKRGKYLASVGHHDSKVKLWRKPKRRGGLKCKVLKGHTAEVNDIAFSIDGKLLFSASDDNTVRVWDVASRACINVLECDAEVWGVSVIGENRVMSGSSQSNSMLRVWELSSGTVQSSVTLDSILNFPYDQVHGWYVLYYSDNTIKLWESLEDENCLKEFHIDSDGCFMSATEDRLCVLVESGQILLWDFSR